MTVSGPLADVDSLLAGRPELRRESLGNQARVTLWTDRRADDIAHAKSLGLLVEPVSLQQLIVETTNLRGKDQ